MTTDYTITMRDRQGRTVDLYISAVCIQEAINSGATESQAREDVESNAFANAINKGLIGEDAWAA